MLVEVDHPDLSVRRQCELLGLNRSTFYYEPADATPEDLRLMRLIDEQYTACPFYGSRRMTAWLTQRGIYLRGYEAVPELQRGLTRYFAFYNDERLHQTLDYQTPAAVYRGIDARRA